MLKEKKIFKIKKKVNNLFNNKKLIVFKSNFKKR